MITALFIATAFVWICTNALYLVIEYKKDFD